MQNTEQRTTLGRIARVIGACCALVVLITILLAYLLGLRVYRITSGSMQPHITQGDIILTQRVASRELRIGDVITTQRDSESRVVTHRIIEVDSKTSPIEVRLQGDANQVPDPSTYPIETAQRYVLTLF